jgi:hypothetical protein
VKQSQGAATAAKNHHFLNKSLMIWVFSFRSYMYGVHLFFLRAEGKCIGGKSHCRRFFQRMLGIFSCVHCFDSISSDSLFNNSGIGVPNFFAVNLYCDLLFFCGTLILFTFSIE